MIFDFLAYGYVREIDQSSIEEHDNRNEDVLLTPPCGDRFRCEVLRCLGPVAFNMTPHRVEVRAEVSEHLAQAGFRER